MIRAEPQAASWEPARLGRGGRGSGVGRQYSRLGASLAVAAGQGTPLPDPGGEEKGVFCLNLKPGPHFGGDLRNTLADAITHPAPLERA